MRIIVLGSAAGGGFPQWNCNCEPCRLVRVGDPRVLPRTQSSLAVSADGRRWVLLNASPDIRQQIDATPCLQPRAEEGRRHSPIGGIVLTNADVDHVAGLLSLRERQSMSLYAADRVLRVLNANSIFDVLDRSVVSRRTLPLDVAVPLDDADGSPSGLTVRGFAVPGKVALWLENAAGGSLFGSTGDTIGLEVEEPATGARFFYVPGCAAMPADLATRLTGAPLVFFDGTTWIDDEMRAAGVGEKTAGRMGHLCMAGPRGTIAALAPLDIRRKIFIHINNTNPVLIDGSAERREAEAHGWEIAADGMEITL